MKDFSKNVDAKKETPLPPTLKKSPLSFGLTEWAEKRGNLWKVEVKGGRYEYM
jgi:hypothetical protein